MYKQAKSILLLALLCWLGAVTQVWASEPNTGDETASGERVSIAFFEYPPLAHLSASGKISGTVVETVRAICESSGLRCRFRILPVARVYRSVINGDASVIITGSHPDFDQCCRIAAWSYPWSAGIYSRRPADMIAESEADLKYKKIIVIQDWISPYRYFKRLKSLSEQGVIKISVARDNISAIRMLQHNRAEYMWGGDHFDWYLKRLGLEGQFHFKPLIQSPLGLWVDKNRPDILLALNRGYESLKASGKLNQAGNLLSPTLMKTRFEDALGY